MVCADVGCTDRVRTPILLVQGDNSGDPVLAFFKDQLMSEDLQEFIHTKKFQKQQYLNTSYAPTPAGDLIEAIHKLAMAMESGPAGLGKCELV